MNQISFTRPMGPKFDALILGLLAVVTLLMSLFSIVHINVGDSQYDEDEEDRICKRDVRMSIGRCAGRSQGRV